MVLIALAAGGCEEEEACFDDRGCAVGERCEGAAPGVAGRCVPCDRAEQPYDGIDNDCNPRTPDNDLDGDGENASTSPSRPGRDCNDMDPSVGPGRPEMCDDGVDSDCDGLGGPGAEDDPDCGDTEDPTVEVRSPAPGARVNGVVPIRLFLSDDSGVIGVTLSDGRLQLGSVRVPPTVSGEQEIPLDTRSLSDGTVDVQIEVRDRANRTATASLRLRVDNLTPPDIAIVSPVSGRGYEGVNRFSGTVTDPDGLDPRPGSLRARLSGMDLMTIPTSTAFSFLFDAGVFPEGSYVFEIEAADTLQNVATATVGFQVDRTGPAVRFTEPFEGSRVGGEVRVTVTATDASGVRSIFALGQSGQGEQLSLTFRSTDFPDGPFVLTATAVDGTFINDVESGNQSFTRRTVIIDNSATSLQVGFLEPSDGQRVLGEVPVRLELLRGDAQTQVALFVDGVLAAELTRPPWEVTLDFLAGSGERILEAVATDGSGQMARATLRVLQVAAPNLRLPRTVGPAAGAIDDFDVGDFDRDGVPDIVTVGGAVELFRGLRTPSGYVSLPAVELERVRLLQMRLVDVNGDGYLDIVGTDGGRLITLTSSGGRSLDPPELLDYPRSGRILLDAADMDGDGDPDVVVAGDNAAAAYVFAREASGYRLAQELGGDGNVSEVRFVRADGDSNIDIVVGRRANRTVSVFRSDGLGVFGAGIDSEPSQPAERVAIGDVTGDGFPDLVAGTSQGVELLRGIPTRPGFFERVDAQAGSADRGVAVGDIDEDGDLDVLAVDEDAQALSVLTFEMGALSESAAYLIGTRPENLLLVDLDGNGTLEALVGLGDQLVRIENSGLGRLRAPIVLRQGRVTQIDVGPITGAPPLDLVVAVENPFEIRILEGDGQLGFTPRTSFMTASRVNHLAIGQLDAMPGLDIAAALAGSGSSPNRLFLLARPVGYDAVVSGGLEAVGVEIGDFDGNTQNEVAFAVRSSELGNNGLQILRQDRTQAAFIPSGQGAGWTTVGRFTTTSLLPEIAVANWLSENITVHRFLGGTYTSTIFNAPSNLRGITSGRLGTDPVDDIVGVTRDQVFVLESAPVLGFRPPVLTPLQSTLVTPRLVDVNQDGLLDVVVLADQRLHILVAESGTSFFPPITFSYAQNGARLALGDFDGDGRDDLLSTHPQSGVLVVVPNDDDTF